MQLKYIFHQFVTVLKMRHLAHRFSFVRQYK